MKGKGHQTSIPLEGGFRTEQEREATRALARAFESSPDPIETRLENFTKYIRRQNLTRLLALYELFKQVLNVKGSIVECGVHRGFGLMAWANISAVLEPVNFTRRVYGFDTFGGLTSLRKEDKTKHAMVRSGDLSADSFDELRELIRIYDANRFLGHVGKVELVRGNAVKTIPEFVRKNSHLVVSLLFLDFDLFEPTKAAIENFFPRIPKGGIIAFDELDNPIWPGETLALLETIGINKLRLQRIPFDPYIGFAIIE